MYWNQQAECMSRDQRAALQLERLQNIVKYAYDHVAPFRKSMDDKGLLPQDIKRLDDITALPFTSKQDLRDSYPFGRFGAPMSEIVRIHASSGTTGKPTTVGYTKEDIDTWSETVARGLTAAGCNNNDIIQVSYGYGLFTGGLGLHYGVEKIGAAVLPSSVGNSKRQAMMMKDFGVTAICCTPSFATYMIEVLAENNIDPQELCLKRGIFGAEPWSDAMRNNIEKKLNIRAFDIYGLSEICGPGVSMECEARCGNHIFDDYYYPEVIDPDSGELLPEGKVGELVITCLTKKGIPMIRYRTHDLTCLHYGPCDCGRTHVRMGKILGRSDDMLIIRGVNVFPSQIESVLMEMGQTSPYYHIIVDRQGSLDTLEVQVELSESMFSDEIRVLEALRNRIKRNIEQTLGLACKITLSEPHSLTRFEGKAVRVTDKRKI